MKNFIFLLLFTGAALTLLLLPKQSEQAAMPNDTEMAEPQPQATIPQDKPFLIEFYSPSCSICAQEAPILERLEKEYGDRIPFVRVNTDSPESTEILKGFQVDGLPTIYIVRKDRTKFNSFEGFAPEEMLAANLDKLLAEKK